MNLPTLPTDNLYKFISIFGLIIYLTATIYDLEQVNKYNDNRINLIEESNVLLQENKRFAERLANIHKDLTQEEYKRSVSNGEIKKIGEEIIEESKTNNKKLDLFLPKSEKLKLQFNQLEDIQKELTNIQYFSFFMMMIGFILWYFLLQRHADIIISKESGLIKKFKEKLIKNETVIEEQGEKTKQEEIEKE